ncbi:hypothetical protein Ct9H90mP29_21190 [bacterium]|nr:MAG: hypothetical protein Ct9H90mP29_21190 [bacterium]
MNYPFVDWILGEEGTSTSVFSNIEQEIVKKISRKWQVFIYIWFRNWV